MLLLCLTNSTYLHFNTLPRSKRVEFLGSSVDGSSSTQKFILSYHCGIIRVYPIGT